jgi:hypothetical protein
METIYAIFASNAHKSYASAKLVAATTDESAAYAILGNEVKQGNMTYRGSSHDDGLELLREDYIKEEADFAHVDFGFVIETENETPDFGFWSEDVQAVYDLLTK